MNGEFEIAFREVVDATRRSAAIPPPTPEELLAYLDADLSPDEEGRIQDRIVLNGETIETLLDLMDPTRLASDEEIASKVVRRLRQPTDRTTGTGHGGNTLASDLGDGAAPAAPEAGDAVLASELRNTRIDALYGEVRSLLMQADDESSAEIEERLRELRELQKTEAMAMRRRLEAQLPSPPGAGLGALRKARELLAEDADPAAEHEPARATA